MLQDKDKFNRIDKTFKILILSKSERITLTWPKKTLQECKIKRKMKMKDREMRDQEKKEPIILGEIEEIDDFNK